MPLYAFKAFRRIPDGPPLATREAIFHAANDDRARIEAEGRTSTLAPGHFGVLSNPAGEQIWSQDSPAEPPDA